MLDYWTRRTPSFPFIAGVESPHFGKIAIEGNLAQAVDQIEQIGAIIDDCYGANWLRFASEVSRLARGRAYFFAADDDTYDMGVIADNGRLERLRLDTERWRIDGSEDRLTIAPILDGEDADDSSEDSVARLKQLEFVDLRPAVIFEEGRPFQVNAVTMWPVELGDPAELFGLGTFDAFVDVEKHLTLEFEQLAAGTSPQTPRPLQSPKQKPWWRFWN